MTHKEETYTNTPEYEENLRPYEILMKQPYCSYCFEKHTNEVGVVSLKYSQWFCSENCKITYLYKTGLVDFSQETSASIRATIDKCHNSDLIAERKKQCRIR